MKERDIAIYLFLCSMDTLTRWHPWSDRPGVRHTSTLWKNASLWLNADASLPISSAEEAIKIVGQGRLYVFCGDILDPQEFAWNDDLLEQGDVYVQKKGQVVAVRVKSGRYSGFFIPARTWGFSVPSFDMIESIREIFKLFNFEAITPASLSEKVLRSTLGEKIRIYRPASHLRQVLLENNGGGRIDLKEIGQFYTRAYKYDINKAYLFFAQSVPCPMFPPKYHLRPRESWLYDYSTPGFWKVTMVAHGQGLHPIFLDDKGKRRFPKEAEMFTKWLWRDEILSCEQKGYTLLYIHEGYRWLQSSDFMREWGDILWSNYQNVSHETSQRIIKSMMVGLPGRFLREPINHFLVPLGKQKEGDTPIPFNWLHHMDNWQNREGKRFFTNWYLRAEYNEESTALTPIGAYIIMRCRQEIYRLAAVEEARGNKLVTTYIDSATFERPAAVSLGPLPGQYKEEKLDNVWAERNRLVGELDGTPFKRTPGIPQ